MDQPHQVCLLPQAEWGVVDGRALHLSLMFRQNIMLCVVIGRTLFWSGLGFLGIASPLSSHLLHG